MKAISKYQSAFWGSFFLLLIVHLQWQYKNILKASANLPDSFTLKQEDILLKSRLSNLKKLPDAGFQNLISDWVFLQFLQYFGDKETRQKIGYRVSPEFFEVIIRNDPRYAPFYFYLSTSSTLYAGQPGRTVTLMNEGLQHMTPQTPSNSYLVWRTKAIDELLFLGDGEAARSSFIKAAEWAEQSPDSSARQVVHSSRQMADYLENNPNSKPAQINAWAGILLTPVDEKTKQLVIQKIEELGGTITIENGELRVDYRVENE
jgi:hypothetical protein